MLNRTNFIVSLFTEIALSSVFFLLLNQAKPKVLPPKAQIKKKNLRRNYSTIFLQRYKPRGAQNFSMDISNPLQISFIEYNWFKTNIALTWIGFLTESKHKREQRLNFTREVKLFEERLLLDTNATWKRSFLIHVPSYKAIIRDNQQYWKQSFQIGLKLQMFLTMCDFSGDFSQCVKSSQKFSLVTKCQTSQEIINNLQQSLCRKMRALKPEFIVSILRRYTFVTLIVSI